jgi:hypothetical protein
MHYTERLRRRYGMRVYFTTNHQTTNTSPTPTTTCKGLSERGTRTVAIVRGDEEAGEDTGRW